ncbi:MAG TPA: YdcF family protein [Nitrospira sp.]|nr:YdcF family protein [Nitrospira sp.]
MELTPFLFGLYKLVKYLLYPLTWVLLVMTMTTVLLCLPLSHRRLRWARICAVSALILLVAISTPLVARPLLGTLEAWYPQPSLSTQEQYHAVVVLGGGVLERGTLRPLPDLSSFSKNRTACGVDLFKQGYADKLVFTGGSGRVFKDGPRDALEMKRWAERLGVPADAIVTEEQSRTTYENATETSRLLGSASILLVTSASHLPRAAALFTKQGFRVTPVPCDFLMQNRPEDSWNQLDLFDVLPNDHAIEHTTVAVTEWAGMAVYWLNGKL